MTLEPTSGVDLPGGEACVSFTVGCELIHNVTLIYPECGSFPASAERA
jgi:hypothetical protein